MKEQRSFTLNRRAVDRGNRLQRMAISGGLGLPLAILAVMVLRHYSFALTAEEVAAMGAVIGAFVACMHDVLRYIGLYIAHRLGFNPPSEEE